MSVEVAIEYALSTEDTSPQPLPEPRAAASPESITPREEEIAALVARGLTNRQIASELSISEHTVATHVSKIMRKLGLSSRSQLAAWVADQQGPPSPDSD
jgi:DNA-binding NarL/FixJ family response regulator